ncbi:hypothetical protein ACQKP7_04665 [Pseudomonas frederiksbergensis]|uniref:hypothetical protein n=1 Tax=Pseudomonas frederiksbergensis TaxID=104087 RepID=UPI003D006FB0
MDKFLYRFRSTARLLGAVSPDGTRQSGELENLEIYFAPPEQLNDPLEGYREIFFAGDKIVWKNLFKHYLLLLALKSWELNCEDEEVFDLADMRANMHRRADGLKAMPGCYECFCEMSEKIFASKIVLDYIDALSEKERKCFKSELIHHFTVLHPLFISVVMEVNQSTWIGYLPYKGETFDMDAYQAMCATEVTRIASQDSAEKRLEYHKEAALNKSRLGIFLGNTGSLKGKELALIVLLREFSGAFCDGLDELMYPRWYVACFMGECKNSSIWGTYGDNHKAICLKFKADVDKGVAALMLKVPKESSSKKIVYDFKKMPFQEVFYDVEFAEVDFFRTMGNTSPEALLMDWHSHGDLKFSSSCGWLFSEDPNDRVKHWEMFNRTLTSKLNHWGAEKEFRVVLRSNMDLADPSTRKLRYKFKSLEGLIFGISTSVADKIKAIGVIKALCKKHKRNNFKFYQAYYDPASKSICYDVVSVPGFPPTPD